MTTDRPREAELERKFWDALDESPFLMVGLQGVDDAHTRPMTAQVDDRRIWFFAHRSDELVKRLADSGRAIATFASKGHDLFACIHGSLAIDGDPSRIERLWSSSVAAWYERGRDDPEVILIRFDAERLHVWKSAGGSIFEAALLKLTGRDPKVAEQDENRADVTL
ncbi:MAG TPA: pyridoxamine 5'-phosphate oxidase family protein [Sphingomicrobium sp.]|jgi:general stress protein 26|nr:pyridoxamine 5'-phosphate oxidase family protein [Sphingomicrobium sp.]